MAPVLTTIDSLLFALIDRYLYWPAPISGSLPRLMYRSALPTPPVVVKVTDVAPAGTWKVNRVLESVGPCTPVTGTFFCSWPGGGGGTGPLWLPTTDRFVNGA